MDLLVLGLLQKILSGSGNTVIDVIIDAILSETSENPVQNKVVTKALKNKADISHKHTAVEVGADSIGSAETALNDAKKYTDGKIADIINGAPSTLDTLSEIATAMDENKSVVDALDKAIGTKANKADIPTKISELENDSNFLTEHQDLSSYAKTEDIPTELPANGGNADTVNNHTVNTDVPSDAVFTDTVYTLPIATTEILGGVMPDGTTITVDENGVISMLGSGGIQMKLLGRYQASTVPIVVIETPIEVGRMFGFYLEGVLKASYFFRIIMTDTGSKTSKFDITSNTGKAFNFTVQTNMSNGAGLRMSFSEFISTSIYINVYDMGIVEVTS